MALKGSRETASIHVDDVFLNCGETAEGRGRRQEPKTGQKCVATTRTYKTLSSTTRSPSSKSTTLCKIVVSLIELLSFSLYCGYLLSGNRLAEVK